MSEERDFNLVRIELCNPKEQQAKQEERENINENSGIGSWIHACFPTRKQYFDVPCWNPADLKEYLEINEKMPDTYQLKTVEEYEEAVAPLRAFIKKQMDQIPEKGKLKHKLHYVIDSKSGALVACDGDEVITDKGRIWALDYLGELAKPGDTNVSVM